MAKFFWVFFFGFERTSLACTCNICEAMCSMRQWVAAYYSVLQSIRMRSLLYAYFFLRNMLSLVPWLHTATNYSVLQSVRMCSLLYAYLFLRNMLSLVPWLRTATNCTALQHTAPHCNTTYHTAPPHHNARHCTTSQQLWGGFWLVGSIKL